MSFQLTKFSRSNGVLTKRISLNPDGSVKKDGSICLMAKGTAERLPIADAAEPAAVINGLAPNQALGLGRLRDDLPDQVTIVTKDKLNGATQPNVIARTKGDIVYVGGQPGFALLDFDVHAMPESVKDIFRQHGSFQKALASIIPELPGTMRVTRRSTSAAIYRSDTGEELQGSCGIHLYVGIKDSADTVRFLKALHDRCWLNGLGWIEIGTGGQYLDRSIIDYTVGASERLVFEAPPILDHPVAQDQKERRPVAKDGDILDTLIACPNLTPTEKKQVDALKEKAKRDLAPEKAKAREDFVEKHAAALALRAGIPLDDARLTIEHQCDGVLLSDIVLEFDDPAYAGRTVGDVLADPEKFEGLTLADPIEGIEYGRCKAKIMRRADGTPWINSFAHGRTAYVLQSDTEDEAPAPVPPIDLWANFDPPKLPRGLLPEVIETYAFAQGELMGGDPAGLAMSALTVCGAAIPDCIELQVKQHDPSWMEAARLWVSLIGDPSMKKSPMMRNAARALKRMDVALVRKHAAEKAEYDKLSVEDRRQQNPPKKKRLRIEDTTIESVQEILKDSPQGVLSLQDELSGWFGAMDKYTSGRGAYKDRGFWLQTWNGGEAVADRIQRGTCYIPNLSVSLLGGIQVEPLRAIIDEAVDDGLIQRLIPVTLGPASVSKDEEIDDATRKFEQLVERLAGKQQFNDDIHEASPLVIKFTPAAQTVRRSLEQRHLDLLACEAVHPKLAAHIGKYDGIYARLCLIWHCIEARWTDDISENIALRVEQFLHKYLLPHAVAFYASLLQGKNHSRLMDIANHILAHDLTTLTNRDVARCVRSTKGLTKSEITAIFEQLDALGWLTPVPGPRSNSPTRWEVNPMCRRLFAERAEKEQGRRLYARQVLQELFSNG